MDNVLRNLISDVCKDYSINKIPAVIKTDLIRQAIFLSLRLPFYGLCCPVILINPNVENFYEKLAHELAHYITYKIFHDSSHSKNFLYIYYHITGRWNILINRDKVQRFFIKQNSKALTRKFKFSYLLGFLKVSGRLRKGRAKVAKRQNT